MCHEPRRWKLKVDTKTSAVHTVVTETNESHTNVGGFTDYIIQNNTSKGFKGPLLITESTTSISVEKKAEVNTALGSMSGSTSVDNSGTTTATASAIVNTRRGVDITTETTASNVGTSTFSITAGTTIPSASTTLNTGMKATSSATTPSTLELNVTLEQKIDNTSVSHSLFIKLF